MHSRLNSFAASQKRAIFDNLYDGKSPAIGSYDEALLREAKTKGKPQMGPTRYGQNELHFEFAYPDPNGAAVILTVTVPTPERIVLLPVPDWVVESIWQGEISGSYHFESDALRLVENFQTVLSPEANAALMAEGPKPKRE